MNPVTIICPDVSAVEAEHAPIVAEAKALVVTDEASDAVALELGNRARRGKASVEAMLAEPIAAANAAHKSLTTLRNRLSAPFDLAMSLSERAHLDYRQAAKLKAEAERRRLEEEARRAEEERQLADAMAAHEAGDNGLAETILEEAPIVPVVHVEPAIAKVAGAVTRGTWKAEVTDLLALVRFVAAHEEWIYLLEPAKTAISQLARSQKERMKIPGIRSYLSESMAFAKD